VRAADTTNTFEGVITGVVYKNDENGYAVLEVTDDDGSELTAVGILSLFEPGERVCMRGEYVEHPVYGEQMKVEHCETILPTDLVGIERYLGSGLVKGIGPATAKKSAASPIPGMKEYQIPILSTILMPRRSVSPLAMLPRAVPVLLTATAAGNRKSHSVLPIHNTDTPVSPAREKAIRFSSMPEIKAVSSLNMNGRPPENRVEQQ